VEVLSAAEEVVRPPSGRIRVLPAVDASVPSGFFAPLEREDDLGLLSPASPALLAGRIRSDRPDVIAIAARKLSAPAWLHESSLREILSAQPVILFTGETDELAKRRAAILHICSVLPMDLTAGQMRAAVRAAATGLAVTLVHLPREADGIDDAGGDDPEHARVGHQPLLEQEPLIEHLTARETAVLRLMARGRGNKEIASELRISEHTAKFHVSSILAKLGAASRTEAVTIGILHGLVAI
jgi:DNA-binding NarL/FixJ family response regulator